MILGSCNHGCCHELVSKLHIHILRSPILTWRHDRESNQGHPLTYTALAYLDMPPTVSTSHMIQASSPSAPLGCDGYDNFELWRDLWDHINSSVGLDL